MHQLKDALFGFRKACKGILPKVNPKLIADIIESAKESIAHIYGGNIHWPERIRTMTPERLEFHQKYMKMSPS
jgi:hypothetical protein